MPVGCGDKIYFRIACLRDLYACLHVLFSCFNVSFGPTIIPVSLYIHKQRLFDVFFWSGSSVVSSLFGLVSSYLNDLTVLVSKFPE